MLMQFSTLKSRLFSIYDPIDLKILTKLRLKFSYLNEHKLHHILRNAVKPMCDCGADIETTWHFFLCCKLFSCQWKTKSPWLPLSDLSSNPKKPGLLPHEITEEGNVGALGWEEGGAKGTPS